MNAYLNGTSLPQTDSSILLNRAFRYGDGLFETIISYQTYLLPYHHRRLSAGAEALGLTLPEILQNDLSVINTLRPDQGNQKIRLYVYRKAGGLYSPATDDSDWLITYSPYEPTGLEAIKSCAVSESVRLSWQPWSFAKTVNALPYVLAGREKQQRQFDEIILLDTSGHLSEALSSNIFWKTDKGWYTPSLRAGCVAGTRRAQLIDHLSTQGFLVREGLYKPEVLNEASQILTTNANGLRFLHYWNGRKLSTEIPEELRAKQLPVL
jgi:branched-chain amino acid aminotransferase/4-amino-4-deoxychorismate lyase